MRFVHSMDESEAVVWFLNAVRGEDMNRLDWMNSITVDARYAFYTSRHPWC